MELKGSKELGAGRWMALAAALLGWMFDGFEMGIFPLVARPALIDVLKISGEANPATNVSDPQTRGEEIKKVDAQVGQWMSRITAALWLGATLRGWVFRLLRA